MTINTYFFSLWDWDREKGKGHTNGTNNFHSDQISFQNKKKYKNTIEQTYIKQARN